MNRSSFPVRVFLLGFTGLAVWSAVTGGIGFPSPGSQPVAHTERPDTPDSGQWEAPCLGSEELHGWISGARSIMSAHGIPGSYYWICRNIERESGGDPSIVNDWDINARNGTPSIGLLQVIKPTFDAHWDPAFGVPKDQYDPVANIVVACAYAQGRYGSIDNVNGPY